jgi:hypothetical protein
MAAVFIKEYGFMLIIVSFLYLLRSYLSERKKNHLLLIVFYFIVIGLYVAFREFFIHPVSALIVSNFNEQRVILTIWNFFTLPEKLTAAIFLPQSWVLALSDFISRNIYSNLEIATSPVFKTVLFYDLLNIFFGCFFIVALIVIFFRNNSKVAVEKHFAINLYGLSFYFIPFIFLTLSNYMFWIDSRYLYLPAAIVSIFLFSSLARMSFLKKRKVYPVIGFCLWTFFVCAHAFFNHTYFISYAHQSNYRLHAVQTVSEKFDFNKKQQIIYIKTSDGGKVNNNDIFGMGTSFGKELLIWNWFQDDNKNKLPLCLYDPLFLFKHPINDYKQCDGKGYGYFQDIHLLARTIKKYHIDKNDIIALNYDSKTNKLTDISGQIRKTLRNYE